MTNTSDGNKPGDEKVSGTASSPGATALPASNDHENLHWQPVAHLLGH